MTMSLIAWLSANGTVVPHHQPWPRVVLDRDAWRRLAETLADSRWITLGLWGDRPAAVHVALREPDSGRLAVASLDCVDGRFPSLAAVRPALIRFERTVQDLFGLTAEGLPDPRPWLDHDVWPQRRPLAENPAAPLPGPAAYDFLPVTGDGLHQIPVGPVHAGIIEPGHFRFTCNGETVVRLEQRLGYVHKGTEALMHGKPPAAAARLAARASGDSTVAHSLAFARAVEAALAVEPPARAVWLRGLMAELERLANHLFDVGAICNDAAFAYLLAEMSVLRERVLQAADRLFGHRLMMDRVIPGGVAADLDQGRTGGEGAGLLRALTAELRRRLPPLIDLVEHKASLLERTMTTGIVRPDLARRFMPGGFIGRAAGLSHDARRDPGYPPYDQLSFTVPVLSDGDVNARIMVRVAEIDASLSLVDQILDRLPPGPLAVPLPAKAGEGMAVVESFRGEIVTWLRLAGDGTIARCFPRDPSWLQWPLLEAAIEGNIVADFPLCNKSFNCSYSGQDL